MANSNEPMIKLEPGGKAPIISYNVSEPTSYSGRNFIELQFPDEYFKPSVRKKPPEASRTPIKGLDFSAVKTAVLNGMKSGFSDSKLFPNIRMTSGGLRFVDKPNPGLVVMSAVPISHKLAQLDPDEVASMMQAGMRLNIHRSMYGTLTYDYVPEPTEVEPRLYLVETYRLSSFLGSYGAGRVIKTFSLLPGEKTKISVKTYTKREIDAKSASSILDSFTQESADDFESSIQEEHSNKKSYTKTKEYYGEVEGGASWGFGSASAKAGFKASTNSTREEFAKNVANATQKHASKSSAKRDVQINTSYEVKEQMDEETSLEREIQNINLSRTLNFVFRQMNQEFISILHLIDVRVAFFNGFAESKREVCLPELDSLLEEVIIDAPKRQEVKNFIVDQLQNIFDCKDQLHSFIEEKVLAAQDKYWRVKKDLTSIYKDQITGTEIVVPGIILSAMKSVLRTEGVIVEALLGEGGALDGYATHLQELEVKRRESEVAKVEAEAQRANILNQVVKDKDSDRAKLLADLTCPCGPDNPALRIVVNSQGKEETP